MSNPAPHAGHGEEQSQQDGLESVVHLVPLVLPVVGGVLMFLLAFIAISMA
jgi:hypothetical protein